MRYVMADNLTEGMILGKPFYGNLGQFMLRKHAVLTESLIKRIRYLGYSGLYITDDYSDGIEPNFVVSDELKNSTAEAVRHFMSNIQSSPSSSSSSTLARNVDQILSLVKSLVNEIAASKNAVVNIIDLKSFDLYTYQHSVNVCVLAGVLGSALKMTKRELFDLATAAIFHDIGKLFVSKEVLDKQGPLSKEECETMKRHPALGCEYIRDRFYFKPSIYVPVVQHHERHDGSGYPSGLAGDEISLSAKIVAMTDTYDAITSKRPYHEAIMPHEACEYIMGNAGRHFDPKAVGIFFRTVAPYPVGVSVQLSNGQEGIVFRNYDTFPMRPLIKLKPQPGLKARFLDLCNDPSALNVTISKLL